LCASVGVQGMYAAVGALGVGALLHPFGGPSVAQLFGAAGRWGGGGGEAWRPVAEAAVGLGVAAAELRRGGVAVWEEAAPPLQYEAAQAVQMAPLFAIAGGEARAAVAVSAIVAWQLALAAAEELYYRGLVQTGVVMLLQLGGGLPPLASESLAALASAALFGLVHTEFAESKDDKERWFRVTASYGMAYSLLYTLSGHCLLAPMAAHAGMNIGLCVRDWRRMRATPGADLKRIFAQDD